MTTLALLFCVLAPRIPASVELAAWAVVRGVPVDLAVAVASQETGNYPETERDSKVGPGARGRTGVNPNHWRFFHARSRKAFEHRILTDRTYNFAVGTSLLAESMAACPANVARYYNSGSCQPNEAGDRYQDSVRVRIQSLHRSRRTT